MSPSIDHIRIADLPEELARLHMRVERAEWPLDGEPTIYLAPLSPDQPQPELVPGSGPASSPVRPRGKLAQTLERKLGQAADHPGDVQRVFLPGGLRIDLMIDSGGTTRLMLARRRVTPSDQEWATVLAYWPYDVSLDIAPERFEFREWLCLRASWPTPEEGRG